LIFTCCFVQERDSCEYHGWGYQTGEKSLNMVNLHRNYAGHCVFVVGVYSTHDVSGFRLLLLSFCVFVSGGQIIKTFFFHSRHNVFRGQCGRLKNSVCSNIAVSTLEIAQSSTTCLKIGIKSYVNFTVHKFVWVLYCLPFFKTLLSKR